MAVTPKSIVHICFDDNNGKIVVGQFPNIALTVWLISLAIVYLIPKSEISQSISSVGNLFLFTWAYLEITQGVNYFRRFLGIIVMSVIISSYFMQ